MLFETITGSQMLRFLRRTLTDEVVILNSRLNPVRPYRVTKYDSWVVLQFHAEVDDCMIWSAIKVDDEEVLTYHMALGGIPDSITGFRRLGNVFYCRDKNLIFLEVEVMGDDVKYKEICFEVDDSKIENFAKGKIVLKLINGEDE